MITHNNNNNEPMLVINSTKVAEQPCTAEIYEFALDLNLNVNLCSYIKSVSQGRFELIDDFSSELAEDLFEINHIRVNPELNNDLILHRFKKELLKSGVELKSPPDDLLMSICYKPIGDLNQIVRFYIKPDGALVFLTENVRLTVV